MMSIWGQTGFGVEGVELKMWFGCCWKFNFLGCIGPDKFQSHSSIGYIQNSIDIKYSFEDKNSKNRLIIGLQQHMNYKKKLMNIKRNLMSKVDKFFLLNCKRSENHKSCKFHLSSNCRHFSRQNTKKLLHK